jgi:lipopolysaccharide export system protein LptA
VGAGLKVDRMTHGRATPGGAPGKVAMRKRGPLAAALGLAVAVATALSATSPASAQVDTRSKAPIDIAADRAEVINAKCQAIWTGAAEAVQEKSRLRADTLTLYSRAKGQGSNGQPACGGVDRIVADGHVFYVTPDQNARGDHAVYTQDKNEIVITGDVIVVKGEDVARGDKLTINTSTNEAQMVSSVTGAGKPGRVRAVVYPDKITGPNKTTEGAGAKP